MAGNTGVPTQKTKRRIAIIKKHFTELYAMANHKERFILDAVYTADNDSTTESIGNAIGKLRSSVNEILVRFEQYALKLEPSVTNEIELKLNNNCDSQFKETINFNGATYVLLTAVEQRIEQLRNELTEAVVDIDPPIQVKINSVSYAKNSIRNLVNMSVYVENKEKVTLNDLFDLLGVGDTIGITGIM